MNIQKKLREQGFAICDVENTKLFKKLVESFVKNINLPNLNKKSIGDVRKSLAKMNKAEVNKTMINFLTFNKNLSEMMINSFPKLIQSLCGKDLFIQRRAHTTINVPGDDQAKQVAHYEMISGISPHAYILWAPLHDLEDDGGAYHIDIKQSVKIMRKEERWSSKRPYCTKFYG